MHRDSTARVVPGTSGTSNSPAATPSPMMRRTAASVLRRRATISARCSGPSASSSYWTTRAVVWRSACQRTKDRTASASRSAAVPGPFAASSRISSALSWPMRLIRWSSSSLVL
jgi:hypothetical protein